MKYLLILLLLLPVTIFSQDAYRDTVIENLINQKFNEYRLEKGLHFIETTDSLRRLVDKYVREEAKRKETTLWTHHSNFERDSLQNYEIVCYGPASPAFVSKKDGFDQIFSADSIASRIVEAYKNSPGHNSVVLSKAHTKFITSVWVYYDPRKGFECWATFTATEFLDDDWDLYSSYKNLEIK